MTCVKDAGRHSRHRAGDFRWGKEVRNLQA